MKPREDDMIRWVLAAFAVVVCLASPARADEVLFVNGDRLTGTIVQAVGGKLTVKSDTVGEVTVDLSKVKTFSTAQPVQLHVGDKTVLSGPVATGADGTVTVTLPGAAGPQVVALRDLTKINPPPVKWTGSVAVNGMLTRGNSDTETIGIAASAVRRAEQDRLTFGAGYQYGRQESPSTGDKEKTIDYLFLLGKYDYFFTRQLYGYAGVKIERDKIADLDLRLTPGAGVGYQWFEGPTFNLSTEAGIAWIYEDYGSAGTRDEIAGRLAYHVDWRPVSALLLFHNLEWLPAFSGPFDDYLLNGDAGLRVNVTNSFFTEFKGELRRDSTPAPGQKENDWRFLVGVGWNF
jgi:putative salt-induced outer membrane protein YdiY